MNFLTKRQCVLLGGVGAVCTAIVFVVGAVVVELANLIIRGESIGDSK